MLENTFLVWHCIIVKSRKVHKNTQSSLLYHQSVYIFVFPSATDLSFVHIQLYALRHIFNSLYQLKSPAIYT